MMRTFGRWLTLWFLMAAILVLPLMAMWGPVLGAWASGIASVVLTVFLALFSPFFLLRLWSPLRRISEGKWGPIRVFEFPSALPQAVVLKGLISRPVLVVSRGILVQPEDPLIESRFAKRSLVLVTVGIFLTHLVSRWGEISEQHALKPHEAFLATFFVPVISVLKKIGLYQRGLC